MTACRNFRTEADSDTVLLDATALLVTHLSRRTALTVVRPTVPVAVTAIERPPGDVAIASRAGDGG